MGEGMAKNLLKNNVPLVVWNRSVKKCTMIKNEYPDLVTIASTPGDVVSMCNTTFAMLSTPAAMREVYGYDSDEGKAVGSLLDGVSPGKNIVDCGTFTPEDMMWASEAVHARGGFFLEAPVSGSKMPALAGQFRVPVIYTFTCM